MFKIIGADGKEYGPVTAEQIRRWMTEGRVNAQTRVQTEGSAEWRPLADFPEFWTEAQVPPPPTPGFSPAAAIGSTPQERVNGPAVGLMVVAGLNLVAAIAGLVLNFFGSHIFADLPKDTTMMFSSPFSIASNALGLLFSGLIFYGGLQMRKLSSYGLAMTASILAIVPCTSPCCLVGLPIGIWAIVILTKPEVKSAFPS